MRAATLLVLGAATLCSFAAAEDAPFRRPGAFSGRIPESWVIQDDWRGPAPGMGFFSQEQDGDFRIVVSKYAKGNPFGITRRKFIADVEKRMPAGGRSSVKAGDRKVTVFRGLNVSTSSWGQGHFDPLEAVLGPSGGDFSEAGRLRRCRDRGAWKKYAWYAEAYGRPASLELFFRYFTRDDERLLEACLGPGALGTVKRREQPDPAVVEPDAARIAASSAVTPPPAGPPEESVVVFDAKDGFFVLRYESPPGRQDRHYPVFLRLLATFQPE